MAVAPDFQWMGMAREIFAGERGEAEAVGIQCRLLKEIGLAEVDDVGQAPR